MTSWDSKFDLQNFSNSEWQRVNLSTQIRPWGTHSLLLARSVHARINNTCRDSWQCGVHQCFSKQPVSGCVYAIKMNLWQSNHATQMSRQKNSSKDGCFRLLLLLLGCFTSQQRAMCISGTDAFRHLYVLPHWDNNVSLNLLLHPVTGYWRRANQSLHWPDSAGM